ncbi:DUF4402 domain-containing protein [Bdellovibrio bacteriovorus]|uniref:DUF4402 domain-containing protein n=1 Tax=Bdellovibrio bacteriovorus TaxID=959 RepID=UPI0035A5D273
MKNVLLTVMVATAIFGGYTAQAAQGTAKAKMKVVTALAVSQVSDLLFSDAAAGAPEEVVAADSSETAQNASFKITGEPSRPLTVTLPADGTVTMITGSGSPDESISVNSFTSNFVTGLDTSGQADLFVGATRAQLSGTQASGDYEADFVVDVAYQ